MNRASVSDVLTVMGAPELPAEVNTVVGTYLASHGIRQPLDRFVRANDMWWRRLESPNSGSNELMTNEQVQEALVLGPHWAVMAIPLEEW